MPTACTCGNRPGEDEHHTSCPLAVERRSATHHEIQLQQNLVVAYREEVSNLRAVIEAACAAANHLADLREKLQASLQHLITISEGYRPQECAKCHAARVLLLPAGHR